MSVHRASPLPDAAETRPLTASIAERVRLATTVALATAVDAVDEAASGLTRQRRIEAQLAASAGAALRRFGELFRLSPAESDLLQTCVAHAVDPELGAVFARVGGAGGRSYVTDALVARLFGHVSGGVWNPAGALGLWGLVEAHPVGAGEPLALAVDPVVTAWLDGALWMDRALAGIVRTAEVGAGLPSWPVETMVAAIRRARELGRPLRIVLAGDAGSGRSLLAAAIATAAGLPAVTVDTTHIADADWPDRYMRLQRLAAMGGLALVWTGALVARPWPAAVGPAPVHVLTVGPGENVPTLPGEVRHRIVMPEPTIVERRHLWGALVPHARAWPAADLEELATRYRLGVGDLTAIAAEAPATPIAAARAARARNESRSDELLHPMPCPYGWDDLVVSDALRSGLEELAFEAAERERLWEHSAAARLFPRELALVALFAGPSGTGKTMAAQVLAAVLGFDLLRVDLAAVLSKYIGETAKNLERVFAAARRSQAIVLFDEADAHFARRTDVKDAHDRYANTDTSYLLQLIEDHRGICILATNRRGDLDAAFVRRLRYVFEFSRPQLPERLRLWEKAVRAVAADAWPAVAGRVTELAESVDVSGAQIKHAVLSALFMARRDRAPLRFAHLVHGIDRELAKDGRPLPGREKERWLAHA